MCSRFLNQLFQNQRPIITLSPQFQRIFQPSCHNQQNGKDLKRPRRHVYPTMVGNFYKLMVLRLLENTFARQKIESGHF